MKSRVVIWALLLGMAPLSLYANAGTGLMWAGAFHLFIGNALIAAGETAILAWRFSARPLVAFPCLAAANYLSAWSGVLFIQWAEKQASLDIENGTAWLWSMVVATYALTLLIELPFVLMCLFRKGAGHVLKAHLTIQTASYALLFLYYWNVSPVSLLTDTRIVAASAMARTEKATVYFIGNDENVWSLRLNGEPPKRRLFLKDVANYDRLEIARSESDTNIWSLLLVREDKTEMALTNLAGIQRTRIDKDDRPRNSWFNFGEAVRLAETNSWRMSSGFWPAAGLSARNIATLEKFRLAWETPFFNWNVRNMTQLPNDQVVFQLGEDQICLFDPNTMQLALIARGRGPAVALEE